MKQFDLSLSIDPELKIVTGTVFDVGSGRLSINSKSNPIRRSDKFILRLDIVKFNLCLK